MPHDPSRQPTPSRAPCAVCGFWLDTDDFCPRRGSRLKQRTCPNCGVVTPLDRDFWQRNSREHGSGDYNVAFVSVLFGLGMACALWATLLTAELYQLAFPVSSAIGLGVFGLFLTLGVRGLERASGYRAECFRQIEEALRDERTASPELLGSAAQLKARVAEARREGRDASALERALAAVLAAASAEEERAAKARVVQCRIDMIRWQNQLEPLVLDRTGIREVSEWQRRIERVRELRGEGEARLRRLQEDSVLSELPEGKRLIAAWTELLPGCSRLEDELLAEQALCAVEAVQPLHEGVVARNLAQAALDSESVLRHVLITHDFGDLDRAVADLRAQQSRIHAEREAAEELVRVGAGVS
ncbi:MAG: hypothetical protein ACK47B_05330 [Armatimonadota bacterium]